MCKDKKVAENVDSRLKFFIENRLQSTLPSLNNVFKVFLTVPVSSASSERSFSSLRRLKTYVRSTLDQERLLNLGILHIENRFNVNISEIIDHFDAEATVRGRRLQLH